MRLCWDFGGSTRLAGSQNSERRATRDGTPAHSSTLQASVGNLNFSVSLCLRGEFLMFYLNGLGLPDRHGAESGPSFATVLTPSAKRNKLRPGRDFRSATLSRFSSRAPLERGLRPDTSRGRPGGMGDVDRQMLPVLRQSSMLRSSPATTVFSSVHVPPRSAVHPAF